jgi:hypothetical protein
VARKSPNDTAKEKAAKQKKTVIVLGVVLAGAVAFAAHTMMGMSGSPASAPQAADPNATTTAASTPTPAPTGSAPPAAPSLGSIAPTATTPSASTSPLVSAVQAPAGTGQLQSFSLFESKDPFHTSGPGTPSSSQSSPSGGTSGGTASGGRSAPKIPPAPPAPPPTSAVISVNGSSESVVSGSNFPAASPVFQLLSLTATTAKISVVGGSYASGAGTLTLKVNKPVTLVNTADGTRYTLLLMPQGTQASAAGPAVAAPGSTTTTTPVTGG